MIRNSTAETRLCPNCANNIAEDATECFYCKADVSPQFAPRWLKRDEASAEPRIATSNSPRILPAIPPKFMWIGGMIVIALIAFLGGGYLQRSESRLSAQAHLKQLQSKDQMIQSQEAQLSQTRQQLNENSRQLAETKTKLEASQKELSLTQQRLSAAARQADRLSTSRPPVARPVSRDTTASIPQPSAARRTAAPGVYETTRATSVHEDPSSTSRVISQIEGGTRINVVSSAGSWLEVRSKRGNPPGYVRSDDARPISAVN